jgi:hypothetical protein
MSMFLGVALTTVVIRGSWAVTSYTIGYILKRIRLRQASNAAKS